MSDATERLSASIVLVGKFNPAIFHPAWIARTGLVSDAELEEAQLSVSHSEISIFKVGGYAFDVRQDRFAVQVESEPLIRALDATMLIFEEALPHTPVTQIGINYVEHFRLSSADKRVRFGRALAPLAPWGRWGEKIAALSGEEASGVAELTMQETYQDGSGHMRVEVQPSAIIEPKAVGVFVYVNDHRNVSASDNEEGASAAMAMLRDCFDHSLNQARSIVAELTEFAQAA